MATDTDRSTFRSNLRKDQTRSAGGTRDRRKIFEDGGSSVSGSTYSTGSASSRYSRTADRTESPSSRTTTTITSKITKLTVNDDSKNDEEDDRDERKEVEEETSSRRTTTKKYGGSHIGSRITKTAANDDDDDDDGDDDEEEKKEEEEAAPKRGIKKARDKGTSSSSAHKRKERKHLRQKRRSTGVVIMPGQPVTPGDAEEQEVQENTAKNMGEAESGTASAAGNAQLEAVAKQNEQYIEELKDELAKAHRELETLRNANLRLKDENSALLRVVGSLSGTGR